MGVKETDECTANGAPGIITSPGSKQQGRMFSFSPKVMSNYCFPKQGSNKTCVLNWSSWLQRGGHIGVMRNNKVLE